MKRVKFIKDFATKRIGDVIECDGSLASHLVRSDKVAEFTEEDLTEVNKDSEHLGVKSEVEVSEFTEEATKKKEAKKIKKP